MRITVQGDTAYVSGKSSEKTMIELTIGLFNWLTASKPMFCGYEDDAEYSNSIAACNTQKETRDFYRIAKAEAKRLMTKVPETIVEAVELVEEVNSYLEHDDWRYNVDTCSDKLFFESKSLVKI